MVSRAPIVIHFPVEQIVFYFLSRSRPQPGLRMTIEMLRVFRIFYRLSGLHLPRPEPALLVHLDVAADGEEGVPVLGEHLLIRPGHALVTSLEVREVLPELGQPVLQPVELLTNNSEKITAQLSTSNWEVHLICDRLDFKLSSMG